MSDTPIVATPDTPLETPTDAPVVELPEGFGQALVDRFGSTSKLGGLTDYEGGVGVDAVAQLASTPAPEPEPPEVPVDEPDAPVDESAGETPASVETAPAVEAQETLPPESATTAAPGGWDHHYIADDNTPATQHFSDDDVRAGLALKAWSDNLPQDLRWQLGAIASGQAVPIPRADYDRFVAWSQQQSTQSRYADLESLDADPKVIDLLRQQRDQIAQLSQTQQPTPASNVDPNLTAWAMQMDNAAVAWGQARQLYTDETRALWQRTINSGIVRHLATSRAQYSPTGAFLAPADPNTITYEALDFQLTRDPALHAAVLERHANTSTSSSAATPPANVPREADLAIQAKKARAASMAAAPSAVVNQVAPGVPPVGPDLVAAMAAELAPVMNGDHR